jgi:hypothetical protein
LQSGQAAWTVGSGSNRPSVTCSGTSIGVMMVNAHGRAIDNGESMNKIKMIGAARGGSVDLNRFGAFSKWISASVTPPPLRASAG